MVTQSKYNQLFYGIIVLYFIIAAILIYSGFFALNLIIPVAIIILLVMIKSYDKIIYLIAFLTPLSINLSELRENLPVDISLFTEPLLIALLIILIFKFLKNHSIDLKQFRHPISLSLLFMIAWTFISAINSTMPLVSLKFFLSKLWLIIPVFFIGMSLFINFENIKKFILFHSSAVLIVVIYSTLKLSFEYHLSIRAIHFAVQPFYNDHTSYGAVLAMLIPVIAGMFFIYKNIFYRLLLAFTGFMLTIGVVLSFSRASWLGLLFGLMVFVIIRLRIRFTYIFVTALLAFSLIFAFWSDIMDNLEKNKQDSSANIASHISSITNISTDASNVERLNRWYCAVEMFSEKPLFGWGPGTYQFQYAPFQLKRMRTIISTNFGEVGNAHSEYLGPLAEQGLPGALSFMILAITILYTGFSTYYRAKRREVRIMALAISIGFITYFLHGVLNNFLDTDKLAVPFFGFAAILASLDLYHRSEIST